MFKLAVQHRPDWLTTSSAWNFWLI